MVIKKSSAGLDKGIVQVYHGTGKGKTTAAFGLALRAAGHGLNVLIIQFMKESVVNAGEVEAVKRFENIELRRFGKSFLDRPVPSDEEIRADIRAGLILAKEAASGGERDLIILDEINVALHLNVAEIDRVMEVIALRDPAVELVLTGRYPPQAVIEAADLVTEMLMVKHPYDQGILAREGIDY